MPAATKDEIVNRIKDIAERVGASEGLAIVDVQFLGGGGSRLLRIFIDKPEGVSHADCEMVSQQVGTILDVEEVVPGGRYTLEVSSPGLERKLLCPKDYERFLGHKAKIALRQPIANQRHFQGTLAGIADGIVTLEDSSGKSLRFALDQIEKANLKFEW
jgi:ribosome maturation factor RimP